MKSSQTRVFTEKKNKSWLISTGSTGSTGWLLPLTRWLEKLRWFSFSWVPSQMQVGSSDRTEANSEGKFTAMEFQPSQALIHLSAVVCLFLQWKLVGEHLRGPLWVWWYCHQTLQPRWQIGFRSWHLSWSLAASEADRRFPSYCRDQEKLHPRKVKAQISSVCDKFRMGSSQCSEAAEKHTLTTVQQAHVLMEGSNPEESTERGSKGRAAVDALLKFWGYI